MGVLCDNTRGDTMGNGGGGVGVRLIVWMGKEAQRAFFLFILLLLVCLGWNWELAGMDGMGRRRT